MGEKCSYIKEKTGTSFLGSPNSIDFAAFSHALENWWGNPCISHIIKYTIECESNWKKAPILWENYDYQFPRFSTCDEFCRIFPEIDFSGFSHSMGFPAFSCLRKLTRKLIHFPYNEVYDRMQSNGKNHPFYGKSMGTNFPGIPHSMGFTMLREIWWENPCISHVIKYTIGWESNGKKSPILWEKYEYQFPRFSTYNGFSRILPGTNFPDFPHSMGLAVFSHVMGN